MNKIGSLMFASLLSGLLAACGGGGNNGFSAAGGAVSEEKAPAPGSEVNGGSEPATVSPVALTPVYEALQATSSDVSRLSPAEFVAQLNAQGARGFKYMPGEETATDESGTQRVYNLFLKESETTYAYKLAQPSTDEAEFMRQINEQGALGFAFQAKSYPLTSNTWSYYTYYVKDNSSNAKFTYESRPYQAGNDASTELRYVAEMNDMGARGFRLEVTWALDYAAALGTAVSVYRRDTTQSVTYDYQIGAGMVNPEDFSTVGNPKGAEGYKPDGYGYSADGANTLFERESPVSSHYAFKEVPLSQQASENRESIAEFLRQLNEQSSQGWKFLLDFGYMRGPVSTHRIYMKQDKI